MLQGTFNEAGISTTMYIGFIFICGIKPFGEK